MQMVRNKFYIISILLFFLVVNIPAQEYSVLQLYESGNRLLEEGIKTGSTDKIQESLYLLHKGLETNPNYFEILRALAIAYFKLGDLQIAKRFVDRALVFKKDSFILRVMDVFINLSHKNIEAAFEQLTILEDTYSNDELVLYLQMYYYQVIGDINNLHKVKEDIERKYGDNSIYMSIYNTITAIIERTSSVEQEHRISILTQYFQKDIWLQWLLAHYYISIGDWENAEPLLKVLQNSRIEFLEKSALQEIFNHYYISEQFPLAYSTAELFTQKYPSDSNSWLFLGLIHLKQGRVMLAERALHKTILLSPQDTFLQFIYHTILKEHYEDLTGLAETRINDLMEIVNEFIEKRDVLSASNVIHNILYINPLLLEPRRILIDILMQQKEYNAVIREIYFLLSKGYEDESEELQILLNTLLKSNTSTLNKTQYEVDYNAVKERPWKLYLAPIEYSQQSTTSEFQREAFQYYFDQSGKVQLFLDDDTQADYSLYLKLYALEEEVMVQGRIMLTYTKEEIIVFEQRYEINNYQTVLPHDIMTFLENMLPDIYKIVEINESRELIFDISHRTHTIEVDQIFDLYPFTALNTIYLLPQEYKFIVQDAPHGQITIKEVGTNHALGMLFTENAEDPSIIKQFLLFPNIQRNDFIIHLNPIASDTPLTIDKKTMEKVNIVDRNFFLANTLLIDVLNDIQE